MNSFEGFHNTRDEDMTHLFFGNLQNKWACRFCYFMGSAVSFLSDKYYQGFSFAMYNVRGDSYSQVLVIPAAVMAK